MQLKDIVSRENLQDLREARAELPKLTPDQLDRALLAQRQPCQALAHVFRLVETEEAVAVYGFSEKSQIPGFRQALARRFPGKKVAYLGIHFVAVTQYDDAVAPDHIGRVVIEQGDAQ